MEESSLAQYYEKQPYKTARDNYETPSLTENQEIETDMKLKVNETDIKLITKNSFTASTLNDKSMAVQRYLDATDDISICSRNSALSRYLDIDLYIDIEDQSPESKMSRIDSQNDEVLK